MAVVHAQPARGKQFPSLVSKFGAGYMLKIPVPSPAGYVDIQPPKSIVEADTSVWPARTFQVLLLVSEYCAALLEFMTWSFPVEWSPLKAQVAGYARQLLRTSAAVPLPPVQPAGNAAADNARTAHIVWAAFTHCYFHGLPAAQDDADVGDDDAADERGKATAWLHRLVGETGWRMEGHVCNAAQLWVTSVKDRLEAAYPGLVEAMEQPVAAPAAAAMRKVVHRGHRYPDADGVIYGVVYPKHISLERSGRNQVKWTLLRESLPRTIAGSCGVPSGFTQTDNCALGYLVLSDVIEAFCQAFDKVIKPALKDRETEQRQIIRAFMDGLVKNTAPRAGDLQYGYPASLASCALGWELALRQLPDWLAAAAGSAAAARWSAEGVHMELVMPGDMQNFEINLHQWRLQQAELQPQTQLQLHPQPQPQLQLQQRPQQQPPQPWGPGFGGPGLQLSAPPGTWGVLLPPPQRPQPQQDVQQQQQQQQQPQEPRRLHPMPFAAAGAATSAVAANPAVLHHGGCGSGSEGVAGASGVVSGHQHIDMSLSASAHSFAGQAVPPLQAGSRAQSLAAPMTATARGLGHAAGGMAYGGGGDGGGSGFVHMGALTGGAFGPFAGVFGADGPQCHAAPQQQRQQ